MKKKYLIILVVVLVLILAIIGISLNNNKDNNIENNGVNNGQIEENIESGINYSNLADEKTIEEVKNAMLISGLEEENVNMFFDFVSYYNNAIKNEGLVESGFQHIDEVAPEYDFEKIDTNWGEANPNDEDYMGRKNNCRMTTMLLANNLINIAGDYEKDNKTLFMDNDIITYGKNPFFTEENINRFNTFYGDIATPLTKDVNVHLDNVKKYWAEKGISFNKSDASIITVWFHDGLDNNLFVGHTGVLLPNEKDNTLLFVEKISFDEPYQVEKFNNRLELNDYLMKKYDVEYNQPTASPFIMENGELLEDYRPNPDNK